MATITGDKVAKGTRVKIDGRWRIITSDPEQAIIAGEPYPRMLVAEARDSKGGTRLVRWFADDVLPVGGTAATAISFESYRGAGTWETVTVEVIYRKREWGGWAVKLASNGRNLGWVVQPSDETIWEARIESGAFRGTGPDDTGHVLDDVPAHLYNGVPGNTLAANAVGCGKNRDEAVQEMIRRMHRDSAPALGFGAHYAVRPYESRIR